MRNPFRAVIKVPPAIEDGIVIRCLAAEVDGLPIFESVLTVIAAHHRDLLDQQAGLVSDHGKLSANAGGVQTLDWLRDDLLKLRERGRKDE